jgi:short-subunit dehydrogenase
VTDVRRGAGHSIDPKHALIVGAGPGLGAALARRFGREDFTVTLVGRSDLRLADIAGALRGLGISVDTLTADASDPTKFRNTLEKLARRISPGLVTYNAALLEPDNVLTASSGQLLSAYAVNVLGAITAAQVFTPPMLMARAGTFLATSGEPGPAYATLSLGKAALSTAFTLMHHELKPQGVHASSITMGGAIAAGGAFDPDRIAEAYWGLHVAPAAEWRAETRFSGE